MDSDSQSVVHPSKVRRRLAVLGFSGGVLMLAAIGVAARVLDSAVLPSLRTPSASIIYDRHGTPLAQLLPANDARAVNLSLEEMSPAFVAAAAAVTQSQNLAATAPEVLRRLWGAVRADENSSGTPAETLDGVSVAADTSPTAADTSLTLTDTSPAAAATSLTLAERYVELIGVNPAISPGAAFPIDDRLRAALLTNHVARDYSAPELLELYLSVAPFGRGAYGAEDGAQAWFGTSVTELDVGQAAFLAAWLLPATALPDGKGVSADYVEPGGDSDVGATRARNAVLLVMHQSSAITASELETTRAMPLADLLLPYQPPERVRLLVPDAGLADVIATVRAELVVRYGERVVNLGGLHVVTTIDLPYQLAAVEGVVDSTVDSAGGAAVDGAGGIAVDSTGGIAVEGAVDSTVDSAGGAAVDGTTDLKLVVLDDTGGIRAAVGDVFNDPFPLGQLLIGNGEVLLEAVSGSDGFAAESTVPVLEVAASFSILAHAGELRPPYLLSAIGTALPSELTARQLGRDGAGRNNSSVKRHIRRHTAVIDPAQAERLQAELMQSFATALRTAAAVPDSDQDVAGATSDVTGTDAGNTSATATTSVPDLPVTARLVSVGPYPAQDPLTSPEQWLVGWSDQLLVAVHADTDPVFVFADLMRALHYWSTP